MAAACTAEVIRSDQRRQGHADQFRIAREFPYGSVELHKMEHDQAENSVKRRKAQPRLQEHRTYARKLEIIADPQRQKIGSGHRQHVIGNQENGNDLPMIQHISFFFLLTRLIHYTPHSAVSGSRQELRLNNLSILRAFRQYLSMPETARERYCLAALAQVIHLQFLTDCQKKTCPSTMHPERL